MLIHSLFLIYACINIAACDSIEVQSSTPDPCDKKTVEECHECSYWEKHSQDPAERDSDTIVTTYSEVCSKTGYIETVVCSDLSRKTRSCPPVESIELAKFWKFEGFMALTSVLSIIFVMFRMKKLDDEHTERIQRQLSAL